MADVPDGPHDFWSYNLHVCAAGLQLIDMVILYVKAQIITSGRKPKNFFRSISIPL